MNKAEICPENTVPVCIETKDGDLICNCLPIYEAKAEVGFGFSFVFVFVLLSAVIFLGKK